MNDLLTLIGSHTKDDSLIGVPGGAVPRERFAQAATALVEGGSPLSLLFCTDDRASKGVFTLRALFARDGDRGWTLLSTTLPQDDPRYESLTKTVMAAHWYERYAQDMFGIVAEGHPDQRRLVHHENVPLGTHPLRKDFKWNTRMEHADVPYPMHHVEGEGIYEIPVGPIHAGIIEPGHFRFNVAGERIITLEGKLFFTHKGVEKLMEGKTPEAGLPFAERLSGDSAASTALAYCQALESIAGCVVPRDARVVRSIVCELERLTMHVHDLANIIGNGTGYTVVGANGFRIKERLMRLSDRLLGNRFWRGMIVPGGCDRGLTPQEIADIGETVRSVTKEMMRLLDMALACDAERERLETTGVLSEAAARAYGALGVPARASGVDRDVRRDHPYAAYDEYCPQIVTAKTGDVFARVVVRVREIVAIEELIVQLLSASNGGSVRAPCAPKSGMGLGAVEAWRGELLAAVRLENGVIDRCVLRDPSFCNWALFGEIGPGNIVPDFPLCNKTLNLSYSGNDL